MDDILTFLKDQGVLVVFVVVFVEQIGIPLPAIPILMAAGVLAGTGYLNVILVVAAAIGAALSADWIWYELGRRRGHKVLEFLCRIAMEPRSCIMRTEELFNKHGVRSLIAAKFVPGLSIVAPPLAGIAGLSLSRFLLYNGLGIILWVGSSVGLGYAFSEHVDAAMEYAAIMTPATLVVLAAALSLYLAGKAFRRRMELRRVAHMEVDELRRRLGGPDIPLLVDVRTRSVSTRDGVMPGAIVMPADEISIRYGELPTDCDIVVYCACPGDVASADAVRFLHKKGLVRTRVLKGGIEAWRTAQVVPLWTYPADESLHDEPLQVTMAPYGGLNYETHVLDPGMPPTFGTESTDDVDAPRRTMTEEMDASPVKKVEEIPC
jgi:membrane protein DedA with SNARE-associated domain/rhodanese-related sulfurtransferase